MSEIIKLYENVGIEKELLCGDRDVLCGHVRPDGLSRFAYGCYGCEYKNDTYPPFAAEKQLELIKWLAGFWVHINNVGGQINISTGGGYVSYYAEDLADAIALYINSKWDNLTESEREQIRSILNG